MSMYKCIHIASHAFMRFIAIAIMNHIIVIVRPRVGKIDGIGIV